MAEIRRIKDITAEATAMDTDDFAVIDGPDGVRKIGRDNLFNSVPLGAGVVGTAALADGVLSADAPGRAKMADKFVTLGKIDDVATGTILGRISASTGPLEQLSPTDARTVIGAAPFPITGAGVGQFVTLNPGAGAAQVLPAGGTWKWVSTGFVTSGSTWAAVFTCGISAGGTTVKAANAAQTHTGYAERIA